MAHLFKPTYTKPIPPDAEPCQHQGKPAFRWKGRNGPWRYAFASAQAGRCLVESGTWHIAYTDAHGRPRTAKAFKDRKSSEIRLGELVKQVELQKAGYLPLNAVDAKTLLTIWADAYRDFLKSKGRVQSHYHLTHQRIVAVIQAAGWQTFANMDADRLLSILEQWRDAEIGPISIETSNHYLRAMKAFSRWIADRITAVNPLSRLRTMNADVDRKRVRRALSDDDLNRLIETTYASPISINGMAGHRRAMLYLIAAFTGFRASELASLTPEAFSDGEATIAAAYSKSKREDTIPLAANIEQRITRWVGTQAPGRLLFPGQWAARRGGAKMLRADLAAAKIPELVNGRVFDFHALRSQFITGLARAGVSITMAQQLARHSTPTLTAKHYTKLELVDLKRAVDKLPGMKGPEDEKQAG